MVARFRQRSGSLTVVDDEVVIHHPRSKRNWVIPARDVIWVRPERPPTPESTDATTPVLSYPSIIPRLEFVQIPNNGDPLNLCLIFRRPREVPAGHGRPRWAEGALLSAPPYVFEALEAAGVQSSPTLEDALGTFYGTLNAPLISSEQTQTDWQVSGFALTGRGPYSSDPKPVARHLPNENASARDRRQLFVGIVAGAAAALLAAIAWAVLCYFTDQDSWIAAVGVGFAVGWTVHRQARSTTRQPALGIVAALIAFAAMILGWIFLQIATIAEALHVGVIQAAGEIGDLGWGEILRAPFGSFLDWLFFAGSMFFAYVLAARPHHGIATRTHRHPLLWIGGVLAAAAVGAGTFLLLGQVPLGSTSGSVLLQRVKVGDCFTETDGDVVSSLPELPCTQPHDGEVFYIYSMNPGAYPGDDQVQQSADAACSAQLPSYVGETAVDGFDYGYLLPNREAWESGDRAALCLLRSASGTKITGTARASR